METIEQTIPEQPNLKVQVLTLFPEAFPGTANISLAGKALAKGIWALNTIDIRNFSNNEQGRVDDAPFGGGPGMIMRADILAATVDFAQKQVLDRSKSRTLYLSPRGKQFDQSMAREMAQADALTLICGRYEGIDERILTTRDIEEISLGDFILSGGEAAALVLIDAVVRLLPGVINTEDSLTDESFENGLLEYPQYTRPKAWEDRVVPTVLLSGNHGAIRQWRQEQSESLTAKRRPDLWKKHMTQKKRR